MSFATMLQGLVKSEVDFVVVGGVAGSAHGSAHVTNDLDICYDPAPANLERLAAQLARWRAYPREIEPGLPFIMDVRTLRAAPLLTLQTSEGALDCLDAIRGVGDWKAVRRKSERVEAFGVTLRILTLDALIDAKRATGRPKDMVQLVELEALRALRAE